ncbi:MAG TPA: hypothetical protein VNG51_16855 [Ktedonobacteraceae bacterium]|nr:hypothetical protein [Ktedonobacteraceae bacterium]
MSEGWVSLSAASRDTGVPIPAIVSLLKRGHLEEKKDLLNQRVRLVNLEALRKLLRENR